MKCRGQFQPTNQQQPPPPPPPLFNRASLNQQLLFSSTPVSAHHALPLTVAITLPSPVVTRHPPPIVHSSHAARPFRCVFAAGCGVSSFFRPGKCRAAAAAAAAKTKHTSSDIHSSSGVCSCPLPPPTGPPSSSPSKPQTPNHLFIRNALTPQRRRDNPWRNNLCSSLHRPSPLFPRSPPPHGRPLRRFCWCFHT